jgi:hypothetical protein
MDKLADLSATLAQKFGPDAYAAASSAARLSALGNVFAGAVCLVVASVGSYWLYRWGRFIVSENWDEFAWFPLGVAAIIAAVIGAVGCTMLFSPLAWVAAFNPNIAVAAYVMKLL